MTAPGVTEVVAAPEAAPEYTGTKESMRAFVQHEVAQSESGQVDAALGALQGKTIDAISLTDLRTLPGAADLSDAELQAMWNEAKGVKAEAAAPSKPRGYKVYQGDKEVTDIDNMLVKDFLKSVFGYQANNKEQRKSIDEVFRNASLGHYNGERTTQLTTERNQALEQARAQTTKIGEYEGRERAIGRAFEAALRSDFAPLQALIEKYGEAINAEPIAPAAAPTDPNAQHVETGRQVYDGYVMPQATALATQYGIPAQDIADAILYKVQMEPPEYATPQRLQQIVEVEIPQAIEDMLAANPRQPDPRDAQIAELTAKLGKLQGSAATKHNAHVDGVHQRRAAAPAPSPAMPVHGGTDTSPQLESVEDAKAWMRKLRTA